jgi:hypothetical protein
VLGDPTRIRQILVNLIGNALKFTEHGTISIEPHWQSSIMNWCGSPAPCATAASAFRRAPGTDVRCVPAGRQFHFKTLRRHRPGPAIARTLAERMGGTLRAQSEEGRGSVFTLEIPLAIDQQNVPAIAANAEGKASAGNGRHVLLVEDNPVNQTVVEAMLRSLGFEVSLATDGARRSAAPRA